MTIARRNERWKLAAIGAAFAIASALETGLVVAEWTAQHGNQQIVEIGQGSSAGIPSDERATGRSYMPGM